MAKQPKDSGDLKAALAAVEKIKEDLPDDPEAKMLDENGVKLVTYLDQRFWETGALPTNEKAADELYLPLNKIKKYWKNPLFRQALLARGIDLTPDVSSELLTPQQVVLANMLLNLSDKRSEREKCKNVNVTPQQLSVWLRQASFANYMRTRAEKLFENSDYAAYSAIIDLVKDKDLNAAKFFFEMRGIYNPKVTVQVDVRNVLLKVVEIVSTHVRDPATLKAIASDMEQLQLEGADNRSNNHATSGV